MAENESGEARAFLAAHLAETLDRLAEALLYGVSPACSLRLVDLWQLDFKDTLQTEQAVESRRLCRDLRADLVHDGENLVECYTVDGEAALRRRVVHRQ